MAEIKEKFTVGETIELFNRIQKIEDGDCSLFDELAGFANKKANEPIKNDSFLDALLINRFMFNQTRRRMCMLSGHEGDVSFLDILMGPFVSALARIRELGGNAKIIFINRGKDFENSRLEEFIKGQNPVLKIEYANVSPEFLRGLKHFLVCDDMVRIEEPHNKILATDPATVIKANIYFNATSMAKYQADIFEGIWNNLLNRKA